MDSPDAAAAEKSSRARQRRVMLGLLLTFIGALAFWLILPVPAAALLRATPLAAVAVLGLWVGGILLGSARSGAKSRRRSRS
ncbi:MAG: hypothetical protein L3K04_05305 [Thermoplasmata archaeon]|nr:hypothetical protein [Thermoplasmata archaeon]